MINKINNLPESEFIKVFANILENARWISDELYKQKPFADFNELSSKMMNIFYVASKEKKLRILNDHPDLGGKAKISSLTADSLEEQVNAGLDQCTKEEFIEFKKLNDTYKKFGFPFILSIRGKNKIEILNNFRKRVGSEPKKEFDEAIKQVKQIASLRLAELNNKGL